MGTPRTVHFPIGDGWLQLIFTADGKQKLQVHKSRPSDKLYPGPRYYETITGDDIADELQTFLDELSESSEILENPEDMEDDEQNAQ